MMRTLVLEIELPDFYVGPADTEEDVEVAMQLATESVVCAFAAHDGDDPATRLRSLHGRIRHYRILEQNR